MRKEEKLAAAAAQDLLKADASRQRRAAAVQSRKGPASVRKGAATSALGKNCSNRAAAATGKATGRAAAAIGKATGRAAGAPPLMRFSAGGSTATPEEGTGFAGAVPEQNNGSGFGAASPSTFNDGSCFFTGGAGNFFSNAGQSPLPQPWMFPQSADPATWNKNPTPPGGFTNFMQPHLSQNFHFVGGAAQFAPFKMPRAREDATIEEELSTPRASMENDNCVHVESEDDVVELPRTEKRILYTQEEDVRMMSAWLHNSTDSSWHAFFGTAGVYNDINVLNKSPLFIDAIKGEAPRVQFVVNGNQYDTGYYLTDGIYPEWAAFVKTISKPQTEKRKLYAQRQESARKDVECAFGVLQSRFNIVRRPARLWKREDVVNIMEACVILHNMIVEDEKDLVLIPLDLNENPSATIVLPPEVSTNSNPNPDFAAVLARNSAIRAPSTHKQLKNDLVEHIWQRYGPKEN